MGRNFLAHRLSTLRLRTVKVCERCLDQARDAGYQVAEREPAFQHPEPMLSRPA
jgi:hypothetical protein